ncbi:hypothetical protein ABZ816_19150 [Actinosynnema sp. NPDC047251]|uniref:Putative membrane protein n=1 Tax=Saccharothrix espanaensis (strain ATCC 51144 / DSM 44229 / JCM 9112 / NBRC 15066 / NRRL 15764) TaxID=1179773 RepID=K0K8R3_SACES|nr:hypothetical protein [Saccharothrix espanaensis]CCH33224.1 putative membrane protein [Saccharothrix espanaensis DSM 44229]
MRTVITLVAGPVLLLVGVLLMMTDLWTLSHLVFLLGTVLMLPVASRLDVLLRDASPPWVRVPALVLTVVGALALAGQFVIDFTVVRLAAGDRAAAGKMFDVLQESPVFALVFYQAGPALLFIGLALAAVGLVNRSWRWAGGLLVAGALVMGAARITGLRPGEVLGLALIVAALVLAGRADGARAGAVRA